MELSETHRQWIRDLVASYADGTHRMSTMTDDESRSWGEWMAAELEREEAGPCR